jgi:hypothetical protein
MRGIGGLSLAVLLAAGSAMAGDVGVVKGPGYWGPVHGYPIGVPAPQAGGGVTVGAESGTGSYVDAAVGGGAGIDGTPRLVIPAGADRATLLKLRQALAEEAARRGLR